MTQAADLQNISIAVGEVRGQLREVVHGVNNMAQKVDNMSDKVSALVSVPGKMAELEARVTVLEAAENQRVGAMGFGGWLLKVLPIGAISAAIGAISAFLTGRHG
ncbi:hypothetical protein LZK98_11945 [Sphingomonas cannabina]|uniref:hypothetical protein n=1 Tax=Sphingomonas cannabina TaxID=2899123 RepID=UPI001F4485F0|nr:hypothetical protein [Sphingomonas cannabina]UIJ43804.1 hypothetical protein LZK98_11945 [Sphingomonas cannabina]